MTLTERERFIYHAATLMTLQFGKDSRKIMTKDTMIDLIDLIKKNRCRKLNEYQFNECYDDIEEEILLSSVVYEMEKYRRFKR